MYAIIINAIAVVLGSAIGALFKRGISEKYINVLNTAMGLCALALGMNVAIVCKRHITPRSSSSACQ